MKHHLEQCTTLLSVSAFLLSGISILFLFATQFLGR